MATNYIFSHLLVVAIILLPSAFTKPLHVLRPRMYTNGTQNVTALAPKVFLIDMVRLKSINQ